jgi:hypothetical protein
MHLGFFENMFNSDPGKPSSHAGAPETGEIDKNYKPKNGTFFRTLEYPELDENDKVTGKVWMEAGYDPDKDAWVLWSKAIRATTDFLSGAPINEMTSTALFEKTTFVEAFSQMVTFEQAKARHVTPLSTKTPAKLEGDYFKQFAWRECLMMSNSGRLYPYNNETITASNHFNQQDIDDAKTFLDRMKTEQFVAVPIMLPTADWSKAYKADQKHADERLNVLYYRHGDDKNSHELSLQIFGQETPEIAYAHLQQGFKPQIFDNDPAKHLALVKAAINRDTPDALSLLADAGMSFYVQHDGETPVSYALKQHKYSHLHVMLSRDGTKLANYCDEQGNAPADQAIAARDNQAFRMLYQEGLDFNHVDAQGWALVHRAFENGFMRGVYAWVDEGLPIDFPIKDTQYTGVSIAKQKGNQPLIDFAVQHGANADAPMLPLPVVPTPVVVTPPPVVEAPPPQKKTIGPFTVDMLNSALTNDEISEAARKYAAGGGKIDLTDNSGASLFELCWKNRKPDAALDRRALLPLFGELGADSSASLPDGSTVLTRAVSGSSLDLDFLKAIARFAKDPNNTDAAGNNILHALQMNANDAVAHSHNVETVMQLFPTLDINRQNADGYSNVGLAIRLNRSQTLKVFQSQPVDWSQTTKAGWSMLDVAFTAACGRNKVNGAARADKIPVTSDATRKLVLGMLENAAADASQKGSLTAVFNHSRPDGKTLLAAMQAEHVPPDYVTRLSAIAPPGP